MRPRRSNSKLLVAIKDLLRTLELIGKHTDVGAFQDKVEVNAGEDMAELILAARRRHRLAAASRANGKAEEAGVAPPDPRHAPIGLDPTDGP